MNAVTARWARRKVRNGAGWVEQAVLLLAPALLAPVLAAGSLGIAALLFTAAPTARAQTAAKIIQGKVLDGGGTPLPGGIVYLQDQKTNVIKTFIATADGSYRFGQLPADTDYKIWAEFKGQKSKEKLISSFDTKMNVTRDFRVGK